MKVYKFGGTSLGTPQRMQSILEILPKNEDIVLVLSAVSGTTNSLVKLTEKIKSKKSLTEDLQTLKAEYIKYIQTLLSNIYQTKALDFLEKKILEIEVLCASLNKNINNTEIEKQILAQGELISTHLFYLLTQELKIASKLLCAFDFMKLTQQGDPDISHLSSHFPKFLDHDVPKIYIVQGYICLTHDGKIDNLQRGGSDYTATLIGAAAKMEEIQIWTDIDGIHNSDPRIVKNTKPLLEVSYEEATELAYFGGKVLHPHCVFPAQKFKIPIYIKSTLNPNATGTVISENKSDKLFKSVAAKDNITVIRICSERMLMAYGYLEKLFKVFSTYKTPVDMITTSETSISVTVDKDEHIEDIEKELLKLGTVEIQKDKTIVCVVGNFYMNQKGIARRVLEAIKGFPLLMISYGGSQNNISFLIEKEDKSEVLNALYDHLLADK